VKLTPRNRLILALSLWVAAAGVATAAGPNADVTRQQVQDAERARAAELQAQQAAAARAAAAAAEAQLLAGERVAAAARLRQAEDATVAAATRMQALAEQKRQASERLAARADAMTPLLPLIERLSLYPAETLLAVPASPEDTLRGVLVLQGVAGALEQDAEAIRREQDAVDAASQAIARQAPVLSAAQATQKAQAAALDQQIAAAEAGRRQAEGEATAAAQRAADDAARADTLRSAIAAIEAERRTEEARARDDAARAERSRRSADAAAAKQRQEAAARPTGSGTIPSAAQPKGQLTAPVAGTVVKSWGEPTEAGPATGISYQAPPEARVVSPCGGRVVFSAPFRSYGLLMIVDCGGGYHAVLAGFDRLDAKVGQNVVSGEPVGVMPSWDPRSPGSHPTLYVELRRDGQPVNPAPWLKASG
jgi:septal ring factor EnvC (AmiA/AmiB activator)